MPDEIAGIWFPEITICLSGVVPIILPDSDGISPVVLAIDANGSTVYISNGEQKQVLKMKLK